MCCVCMCRFGFNTRRGVFMSRRSLGEGVHCSLVVKGCEITLSGAFSSTRLPGCLWGTPVWEAGT